MNAKRNSIIVTPTKILAYLKKEKNSEEFFYLGSNISGQNTNSNTSELKLYLKKDSIEFKKIFVVADSLPKLMIVFEELKIDYANEYFIMYDEINKFIEDSSYRENLMNAFDYYAKFNPKNRAMVTATFDEYSHPVIIDEEKTIISVPQKRKNIDCLYTNKSKYAVYELIKQITKSSPDDKIVIAINSIEIPLEIIDLLISGRIINDNEVFVACSSSRRGEINIEKYYEDLNNKHMVLPRKIGFITSTYFFGVDILDSYHLITVSTLEKTHHKLNSNDFIQIYGRNRMEAGILSDIIVFESYNKKDMGRNKGESYYDKQKTKYIKFCEEAIELLKKTNKLYNEIQSNQGILKKDEFDASYCQGVEDAFYKNLYIRKNIDNEYEPSYFLIDSLISNEKTNHIYKHKDYFYNELKSKLELEDVNINEKIRLFAEKELLDYRSPQEGRISLIKEAEWENIIRHIDSILESMTTKKVTLFNTDIYLDISNKSHTNKYIAEFINWVNELTKLISDYECLIILKHLYQSDYHKKNALFNKTYNSIVFSVLKDDDLFKNYILKNIEIGRKYYRKELNDIVINATSKQFNFTNSDKAYLFLLDISNNKILNKGDINKHTITINNFNKCNLVNTSYLSRDEILIKTSSKSIFKETGNMMLTK
jgi:hypothetical protein